MTTVLSNAPTLQNMQRRMAALLAPANVSTLPEGEDLELFTRPVRGTIADRLHVYGGGYPARVQEALAETYPAVVHVVGDGAFAALVRRYVADVTLHSYNLNDAGAQLPQWLANDALATHLPFLADLARLEWQVARAFHAYEHASLDLGGFANWRIADWERAVLRFQPSVAVVTSPWPIREIWESRETPTEAIDIDLSNRPDRVLVRRSGYAVLCESVDEAEADLLTALLAGRTLGDVMATLTTRGGHPGSVSTRFARWVALGMLTDCLIRVT